MIRTPTQVFWRIHDQNDIDLAGYENGSLNDPYMRRVFDIRALLNMRREERRPKIHDDIAGADALPTGTIVVDAIGRAAQKVLGGQWLMVGTLGELDAKQLEYPIVLAALSPIREDDEGGACSTTH